MYCWPDLSKTLLELDYCSLLGHGVQHFSPRPRRVAIADVEAVWPAASAELEEVTATEPGRVALPFTRLLLVPSLFFATEGAPPTVVVVLVAESATLEPPIAPGRVVRFWGLALFRNPLGFGSVGVDGAAVVSVIAVVASVSRVSCDRRLSSSVVVAFCHFSGCIVGNPHVFLGSILAAPSSRSESEACYRIN